MQQPLWYDNQIIQTSNLNFMNASTAKNVQDSITAFTGGQPGAVAGLLFDAGSLPSASTLVNVSPGYGLQANGEKVQLYQPSGLNINTTFSGSTSIYAYLLEVNYNPDPSVNPAGANNVVSGLNAASLNYQVVEQYNLLGLTTASGAGYIKLGDVVTYNNLIQGFNYANRQNIQLGPINLSSNTINGAVITPSSIDSSQFVSPLNYNIALNSGVSINLAGSGTQSIGSVANPLGVIAAISGIFHDISGFSPVLVSSLTQKVGTSLEATSGYVEIDMANVGTQFGSGTTGGMVVNKNSIDLTNITDPSAASLNITTQSSRSISLNTGQVNIPSAQLNVGAGGIISAGNITITNGTLTVPNFTVSTLGVNGAVSGNTTFAGNVTVNADVSISGNLSIANTNQQFSNLLFNGQLYPAIPASSGLGLPNTWSVSNSDAKYVVGPFSNTSITHNGFQVPTALATALGVLSASNNWTIESVFNPTLTGGQYNELLVTNNATFGVFYEVQSDGTVYWEQNNAMLVHSAPGAIKNNTWNHVAVTVSGTITTLWVNGAIVSGVGTVNVVNTPAKMSTNGFYSIGDSTGYAGSNNGAPTQFKGYKISNKAHTSFPSGLANLTLDADTVALYDFNSIVTPTDKGPNSYNLIATNLYSYYDSPNASGVSGSSFMGQSYSGTAVFPYANDVLPVGSKNIFNGTEANAPFYLLVSGNNITSGGLNFYSPVDVAMGNTYNVSFFTKLISGSSNSGLNGLVATSNLTGYVNGNQTSTQRFTVSGDWVRNSFTTTIPTSPDYYNLNISIASASGNTVSGASVVGIAGVQITHGMGRVTIDHKNQQFYSVKQSAQVGNGWAAIVPGMSASVWSEGQMTSITSNGDIDMGAGSNGNHSQALIGLLVDGVQVNQNNIYFNIDLSNFDHHSRVPFNVPWMGWLAKGWHTVSVSGNLSTNNGYTNLANSQMNIMLF